MKYLLDTTQPVPAGVGFVLFGPTHLLWLLFFVVFTLGCCILYRTLRSTQRDKMRLVLAALLFPSWATLPFPNLMHLHSFTVHTLLVAYPVMLLLAGELRPSARYIPQCLVLLVVLWYIVGKLL